MGAWISPLDVVINGNRKLHAVEAIRYQTSTDHMEIKSLDAPLVTPGEPALLNFNNRSPLKRGMHFNLHNNIWGTNFPMWYEGDARFRFRLEMAPLQRTGHTQFPDMRLTLARPASRSFRQKHATPKLGGTNAATKNKK